MIANLPERWRSARFRDLLVAGVRNGLYKPKEFHGTGAQIVNMGELFAHPRLRAIPMRRIEVDPGETERFGLAEHDLLFARRSLVAEGAGKCAIVMEVDGTTVFESSIIRARPDTRIADSLYLFYLWSSPLGAFLLGTIRRQVAVAGITGSDLEELEIPLPPLPEQRSIAGVLGALDDKIEQNHRTSAALERLAAAIFRAWFVDFEPVRAKAAGAKNFPSMPRQIFDALPNRLVNSPLGPVPEGWKVKALSDLVELTMGQSPSSAFYNESCEGLPFHQGVTDYGFRFPTHRVFCTTEGRIAGPNDVLLSVRAPVGRINVADRRLILGRGLAGLRHRDGRQSFLLQHMRHVFSEEDAVGDGTIYKAVTKRFLASMLLLSPPDEVEDAFEAIARPIDQFVISSERESRKLAQLRDYMLPRLLSGAVRVREAKGMMESGA